jgi:hypothetical protein
MGGELTEIYSAQVLARAGETFNKKAKAQNAEYAKASRAKKPACPPRFTIC